MPDEKAESDVLAVLELLAKQAPMEWYEALTEEARQQGLSAQETNRLERAKRLGLIVHTQVQRHQRRESGLSALVDTARELSHPQDLHTVLRAVTRRSRLLLGLDMSWISFPDDDPRYSLVRSSDGHISALNVGLRLPYGEGIGGDVMSSPAPFWTADYLADQRIRHSPAIDQVVRTEGLRAMMGVPLSQTQPPFGVLYVADRNVRHFTADEISLMASLGQLAGAAIGKAESAQRTTDQVTELQERVAHTEATLQSNQELSDSHIRLVDLALNGGELHTLASEASKELGGMVRVYAPNGTTLASCGDTVEAMETALEAASLDAHAAREPVPLAHGGCAAPISAGAEVLGTLFLYTGRPVSERDRQALRRVTQAIAVLLLLDKSRTAAVEGQVRDEFLDDLLTRSQRPVAQLERRARRLNVELNTPHVVVVARPEGEAQGKAAIWASSYAQRMNGLKSRHQGCVVLLLPGTDAGEAARAVGEELSPLLGHPVTVGAAGPVTGPRAVYDGHREAQRCLDALTALGATGGTASARELGFLGVLLSDHHDVEGFITTTIGPVLDHDAQHYTELTHTLEAYFETGGSPTYAAKRLHVHPNTVARRIERISSLLGPQWTQPDRALDIHLALRLTRIRRGLRGGPGASRADHTPGP
ncbi:GAF domain-containing protein [Streptomyces sp. HSW2009]|uniref:helix-turn-helix domain-containing protein n=1 Tax=Streptomyces sp. HSW2009 TaxID=3142890 RepID=UPI0032EF1539